MRLAFSLIFLLWCSNAQANLRDGLVGWWSLDETSGTTSFDSSWKGRKGTWTNTPTSARNCQVNNCLNFVSASSQYVSINSGMVGDNAAFTISVWFKTTTAQGQSIYHEGSSSSNNPIAGIQMGVTGTVALNVRDDALTNGSATSTNTYLDGLWHNAVGVQQSKSARDIYVDGVLQASSSTTVTTLTINRNAIGELDRLTPAQPFNGQIDDVRIYNRALTAQEILDLYNSGIQIKGSGTKLNY